MRRADDVREQVIGFDCRLRPKLLPDWGATRTATYLLREVAVPLSVDQGVWPRSDTDRRRNWRVGELYDSLADLPIDERSMSIAVTCAFSDRGAVTTATYDVDPSSSTAPVVDPSDSIAFYAPLGSPETSWTFLGYDVADGWLLSGLSNCGYSPSERAALVTTWGPKLNEWHCFADLESASAFRDVTNHRVPEHAPFLVFGLYRVRDDGT